MAAALEPLTRLVLELNSHVLHVRYLGGAVTPAGFGIVIAGLFAGDYRIMLANDPSAHLDRARTDLTALGEELPTFYAGALGTDAGHAFRAEHQNGVQARPFNTIASYTSTPVPQGLFTAPEKLGLRSRHGLPMIEPASDDRIEVMVRWFLVNQSLPRRRFLCDRVVVRDC